MMKNEGTPLLVAAVPLERLVDILRKRTLGLIAALWIASLTLNIMVLFPWCIFVYLQAEPEFLAELMHAGPCMSPRSRGQSR